jgi:hypothetical protein
MQGHGQRRHEGKHTVRGCDVQWMVGRRRRGRRIFKGVVACRIVCKEHVAAAAAAAGSLCNVPSPHKVPPSRCYCRLPLMAGITRARSTGSFVQGTQTRILQHITGCRELEAGWVVFSSGSSSGPLKQWGVLGWTSLFIKWGGLWTLVVMYMRNVAHRIST